jgi:hypothetical protein
LVVVDLEVLGDVAALEDALREQLFDRGAEPGGHEPAGM